MRAIICGGRDFEDERRAFAVLDRARERLGLAFVIEGGARGADRLARRWAEARGVPFQTFPADWNAHGRGAGPKRNQRMLDEGSPSFVIAFPGGTGTADMCRRAEAAGLTVYRIP